MTRQCRSRSMAPHSSYHCYYDHGNVEEDKALNKSFKGTCHTDKLVSQSRFRRLQGASSFGLRLKVGRRCKEMTIEELSLVSCSIFIVLLIFWLRLLHGVTLIVTLHSFMDHIWIRFFRSRSSAACCESCPARWLETARRGMPQVVIGCSNVAIFWIRFDDMAGPYDVQRHLHKMLGKHLIGRRWLLQYKTLVSFKLWHWERDRTRQSLKKVPRLGKSKELTTPWGWNHRVDRESSHFVSSSQKLGTFLF